MGFENVNLLPNMNCQYYDDFMCHYKHPLTSCREMGFEKKTTQK